MSRSAKKPICTRAAINGLDLGAVKRARTSLLKCIEKQLPALESFASETDISFESACDEFQEAAARFEQACAGFIEYQSEDPDAEFAESEE